MDVIVRANNNPVNEMTAPVSWLINDLDKVMKTKSSLCLPLLTHTLSYIIHLLMTYNYRCLLPQIEYLSYFTLCSHV